MRENLKKVKLIGMIETISQIRSMIIEEGKKLTKGAIGVIITSQRTQTCLIFLLQKLNIGVLSFQPKSNQ